jgi:hypothetical protein
VRLTLLGQCLSPRETFLACFRKAATIADLKPLLKLEDNYVAIYESGCQVWIVNSIYSLNAYFYAQTADRFLHGDTIYTLAQKGPVDLSWNYEAIADLMALGHLVGDDTLACGVHPVPQGAILHWDGTRLTLDKFRHQELAERPSRSDLPDLLIDLFLDGLKAGVGGRVIATASSGLDSRVNLAGILHLGLSPELCVMGDPLSKDVQIVKQIARSFDLRVNHILLEPRDYIEKADEICRLTNGVKQIDAWHTHILARKSGYNRNDRVITGNNGEHVRGVGFDYGILATSLDQLSRFDNRKLTGPVLAKYWKMKTGVLLRPDELRKGPSEFSKYYGTIRQNQKLMRFMPTDQRFVSRSDAFVLEQRRRGFQACGLKLMDTGFSPYSAFMRKNWIDTGWTLDLSWRLGSRWHRYAVERLYPKLLEFPEEKEADRMLRRQRPLAWVPYFNRIYARPKPVHYMDYSQLLKRREIVGLLQDHSNELEDFLPRTVLSGIIDEQLKTGSRTRLVTNLIGMAVWRASMREMQRAPKDEQSSHASREQPG